MKLPLAPSPWHPGQIIDADGFLVAEVRDTVQRMTVIEAINSEEYDHQTIDNLVKENAAACNALAELQTILDDTRSELELYTKALRERTTQLDCERETVRQLEVSTVELLKQRNLLSDRCAELARERDGALAKLNAITSAGKTNDAEDLLRQLLGAHTAGALNDDLWEEVNGYLNS